MRGRPSTGSYLSGPAVGEVSQRGLIKDDLTGPRILTARYGRSQEGSHYCHRLDQRLRGAGAAVPRKKKKCKQKNNEKKKKQKQK